MRYWLCLVVAACGTSTEPAASPSRSRDAAAPANTPSAVAGNAAPTPASPAARPPKPARPPLTAAHGAEIIALGATADGGAVVSADRLGGIRLWTTLDGTREPVVIHGTAPRSITLGRDGDGFLIGVLDAAGGVQVIRASAAGAVRDRVTTTTEQPALEIESTSEGLLILRADQTIELVAGDGAVRSRLTPDPGSHVESLIVRDDHILALVLEDKQVHGRWIVLDHGARWGEVTPKLPFPPARAALSPDGKLLAVSRPRHLHPTLVDVATGKPRKTALCVAHGWPAEDGMGDSSELLRGDNPPVPLGFVSNTVVACSVMRAATWWNVSGEPEQTMVGSFSLTNVPSTVTARGVIAGSGISLVLGTPYATRFLGYGMQSVSQLRAGAAGVLIHNDQHSYVIDTALRERTRIELGRGSGMDWSDVVLLDERYAITTTTRRREGNRTSNELAVFDGVTRTQRQLLPYDAQSAQLSYEPATRLLATSDGASSLLVRYDPTSHTFGAPIRLANAIMTSRLALVDPAQAAGVAVLEIDTTNDGVLVGEVLEADLDPAKLAQPRTTYRVPGELRAVDRAGRLYMKLPETDDVVIYLRGNAGPRVPGVGALALRPNADGSQIAGFAAPRMALFTRDGKVRWDTAHWSNLDVNWSPGGELIAAFNSALATVDLETGALVERRCGWGFGLTDQQLDVGNGTGSICDSVR